MHNQRLSDADTPLAFHVVWMKLTVSVQLSMRIQFGNVCFVMTKTNDSWGMITGVDAKAKSAVRALARIISIEAE